MQIKVCMYVCVWSPGMPFTLILNITGTYVFELSGPKKYHINIRILHDMLSGTPLKVDLGVECQIIMLISYIPYSTIP